MNRIAQLFYLIKILASCKNENDNYSNNTGLAVLIEF